MSIKKYKPVKEIKKVVWNVRAKLYKEMYKKLNNKEVENDIYRIAQTRESGDLYIIRCVKDENQK